MIFFKKRDFHALLVNVRYICEIGRHCQPSESPFQFCHSKQCYIFIIPSFFLRSSGIFLYIYMSYICHFFHIIVTVTFILYDTQKENVVVSGVCPLSRPTLKNDKILLIYIHASTLTHTYDTVKKGINVLSSSIFFIIKLSKSIL